MEKGLPAVVQPSEALAPTDLASVGRGIGYYVSAPRHPIAPLLAA